MTRSATVTRMGVASTIASKVDLTKMSEELQEHRSELKQRTEIMIEQSIKKIRELRLAGMVNKQGADVVCNNLILALQALEEMGL